MKVSKKITNLSKQKSTNQLIELVGWYGTLAIIGSYALISFGFLTSENLYYQLLNFTGALGLISISIHKGVYQSVTLNLIWSAIALLALIKLFL